eukprot:1624567-Amphidinium_carterae.1
MHGNRLRCLLLNGVLALATGAVHGSASFISASVGECCLSDMAMLHPPGSMGGRGGRDFAEHFITNP